MRVRKTIVMAAVIGFCMPGAVAAQNYRFDLGINGGGSFLTSALDSDHLMTDANVRFEPGWLTGAQATLWFTPRIGVRANFGYADRGLDFDPDSDITENLGDEVELIEHVNLWTGTGDLMLRFAGTPREEFMGPEFLPFVALGLGARWVNPAGAGVTVPGPNAGDDVSEGAVFTLGDDSYFIAEQTKLLGRVALGSDIRVSPRLAFRLELGDMMWDAPFERVTATDGGFVRTEPDGEDVGKVQHELYATAGIHLAFGLQSPPAPVAALPAPPPPPPAPEPEPEPEPMEEAVTVCVIDPAAPGGVTTLSAVYRPATGDTLVDDMGQQVALAQYGANVRVAGDEEWYRMGRPLTIEYDNRRVEFIAYGADRPIDVDLVVLGTIDGLPVYADASAASGFRNAAGASLTPDTNLETLLTDRPELRRDFEAINVLYVPAQPVGCVFGPLQRTEDVRK